MDNYEAIIRMDRKQIETFLDHVYLTGLNTGTYAAMLEPNSEGQSNVLDENPYAEEWLAQEAEDATRYVFTEDGDDYLPDALCKTLFRIAGIEEVE